MNTLLKSIVILKHRYKYALFEIYRIEQAQVRLSIQLYHMQTENELILQVGCNG